MPEPSITKNTQEAELHRKETGVRVQTQNQRESVSQGKMANHFVSNTCREIARLTDTASCGILLKCRRLKKEREQKQQEQLQQYQHRHSQHVSQLSQAQESSRLIMTAFFVDAKCDKFTL